MTRWTPHTEPWGTRKLCWGMSTAWVKSRHCSPSCPTQPSTQATLPQAAPATDQQERAPSCHVGGSCESNAGLRTPQCPGDSTVERGSLSPACPPFCRTGVSQGFWPEGSLPLPALPLHHPQTLPNTSHALLCAPLDACFGALTPSAMVLGGDRK